MGAPKTGTSGQDGFGYESGILPYRYPACQVDSIAL